MNDPLVSIILRSYNEGWALCETLPALRKQEYSNWELIAIDSGSTDGSVDLLRAARPSHLVQIASPDYVPGRVMNLGMKLARGRLGIFLNADATPADSNWLRPLVAALLNDEVAAVFGRQIPRPDCRAVFACDYERCFGPERESATWDHFFSMVSSGLKKEVWERRGFLETLQYAEDDEYTRWCRAQGWQIAYCPESVVWHSHNYTGRQAYRRSYGDARALAAAGSISAAQTNWLRTLIFGWLSDVRRDVRYCLRFGRTRELGHAAWVRWQQRRGKWRGYREARRADSQ
jgi:rhamnosyltransferase